MRRSLIAPLLLTASLAAGIVGIFPSSQASASPQTVLSVTTSTTPIDQAGSQAAVAPKAKKKPPKTPLHYTPVKGVLFNNPDGR